MKKLKYLLLAVFVSCAFVLAGCGDGQLGVKADANIGNVNSYVEATTGQQEAFITIINDAAAVDVSAYRITMDMSMEEEGSTMTVNYNGIFAEVDGSMQMAMKVNASMDGEKQSVKMWIADNVLYMDYAMFKELLGTSKVMMPLDGEMAEDYMVMLEEMEQFDLTQILNMARTADFSETAIKVNVEDTITRYELSMEDEGVESKMYLVFESGVLTGCKITTNFMGVDVAVAISAFDGEIEFPNPDGFKDLTNFEG